MTEMAPRPKDGQSWLGIDIGGANLKAAHSDGQAQSLPFAVWKEPELLSEAIAELASGFPPFDRVAATMTAELCDCYATKREGVFSIVDAVSRAFTTQFAIYWGTDGRFHDAQAIRRQPLLAAASNWLALATVAARLVDGEPALLIDVGSTTADLIPIAGGKVLARDGRTPNGFRAANSSTRAWFARLSAPWRSSFPIRASRRGWRPNCSRRRGMFT